MDKIDFRNLDKKAQAEVRRRAVRSYLSQGRKNKLALSKMYEVTQNTITKWINNYEKYGEASFSQDKRGAKAYQNSALNKQQQNWLKKQLINKTPDQFNFPFMLWTRGLVAAIVHKKYGIKIDVSTAGEYLKNFEMTPQKPILKSYKQQPKAVQEWIDNEYPKVVERAKEQNALIFWGDETGVRSEDQVGRGYSLKGKKPIQTQAGYRFRINMISAINNSGNSRFMLFKGRMNGERFIEFLRRLIKGQKHKIILIIDNAAFHKSAVVKSWSTAHADRIELVFLPTYTPELNPDEYLNNALKQKLNYRQKAKTAKELGNQVSNIMRGMQANKNTIKNFFRNEKVKYAA